MALRVSAAVLPPLPQPKTTKFYFSKFPNKITNSIQQIKPNSSSTLSLSATLFTLIIGSNEAQAEIFPKDKIVSSINQAESTIDQIQQVGSDIFSSAGQVFGAVSGVVKPGVDLAFPILKQVGEEALKIAYPVVSEASKKAQEAIQSSGFDTQPVLNAAKTVADAAQQTTKVIDDAKPIATSTVQTISTAEPVVILATGSVLILAYFLLPPVLSAISFSLRGYQGDLTPAQTLDLMSTKNYFTIDIRSEKDKDKAGIPRLPSSAKNNLIPIPLEELPSKLRNIVRSSKKVEAELVALKISYLKRISKGSNIVIMDSYSDSAKIVARALTKLGFKSCWIVSDGFSGSKGWLQSRLGIDSYNLSFTELVSPSRIIPAATRRFGTSAKLLPGGSD